MLRYFVEDVIFGLPTQDAYHRLMALHQYFYVAFNPFLNKFGRICVLVFLLIAVAQLQFVH